MAFVQTTYNENMAVALPGMVDNHDFSAMTFVVEGEDGAGFGKVVSQGTTAQQCVAGAVEGAILGITIRDIAQAEDQYRQYANASVMYRGDIWVTVTDAVTFGTAVTANAAGDLGAAGVTIPGARWMSSAAAGGLARLKLSGEVPVSA